jgi:hypothetical protein
MRLNKLVTSIGSSRGEHVAAIMQANDARQQYDMLHREQFIKGGAEKFVVVNADGKIVGRAKDPKSAQGLNARLTNANGTVRHEDFLVIQDRVLEVRRRALNGISDLMMGGLSFPVSIEDQLVGFENVNEFQEAEQALNPTDYQNNDTVYTEDFVPNPITHQSFSVPFRQSGFDYKRSLGLVESTRQVGERLENTLFNGNTSVVVTFNGTAFPLYGYTTHPDRGTGTISDWTNPANIALIVPETIAEIGAMFSSQGGVSNDSVVMYVANDLWTILQKDYKAAVAGTVMARLMQIAALKDVKPAEKLAAGEVVLVEMSERTIQLAVASDIITVPHVKTNPMMPQVLTTYAAMVQQIKVDSNGNTGIRHLTT